MSCTSSRILPTGTLGCTVTTLSISATSMMGAKSLEGLNGKLANNMGLVAKVIPLINKVCPSGADLATKSVPMLVAAPGLYSTTTGLPKLSCNLFAMARAKMSEVPPGVAGTMILIGLLGKGACAQASELCRLASKPITLKTPHKSPRIDFPVESIKKALVCTRAP